MEIINIESVDNVKVVGFDISYVDSNGETQTIKDGLIDLAKGDLSLAIGGAALDISEIVDAGEDVSESLNNVFLENAIASKVDATEDEAVIEEILEKQQDTEKFLEIAEKQLEQRLQEIERLEESIQQKKQQAEELKQQQELQQQEQQQELQTLQESFSLEELLPSTNAGQGEEGPPPQELPEVDIAPAVNAPQPTSNSSDQRSSNAVSSVQATEAESESTTEEPISVDIALSSRSDSGALGDLITNINNTSPSENLVFVGSSAPDASINVAFNGKTYTTKADAVGNWRIETSGVIEDGEHIASVTATNASGGKGSGSISIVIDTTPPEVLTARLAEDSDSGLTDETRSDGVTNVTTPEFTGVTEQGATVTLTINGQSYTSQPVGNDGIWRIKLPDALVDNVYNYTVIATDAAGNTIERSTDEQGNPLSITIKTTIELTGGLHDDSDSGVVGDEITNNNTPTFSGSGEVGAEVTLSIDGNTYLTTVTDNGRWEIGPISALAVSEQGGAPIVYDYTLSTVDIAGSEASMVKTFTLDTSVSELTAGLDGGSDSGTKGDEITSDSTPEFSGTAEPNSTITLTLTQTVNDEAEVVSIGTYTATANEAGRWSILAVLEGDDPSLPDGIYTYQVTAIDVADNTYSLEERTVKIDTVISALSGSLDTISDSGISNTDGITNDVTPVFSGQGEAGADVNVLVSDELGNEWQASTIVNDNGSWTLDLLDAQLSDALPQGAYTYIISSTDAAGNYEQLAPNEFTIDTEAQLTVAGLTEDTNSFFTVNNTIIGRDDQTTNINLPKITGTGEAGNDISLVINGEEYKTIVADDGNWTVDITNTLPDGAHEYLVRTSDVAGNLREVKESLTIDTVAPSLDSANNGLSDSSDTGSSQSDNITNDNTPTFTGVSDPNIYIVLTVGDDSYITTTDSEGHWSVNASNEIPEGIQNYTISAYDSAGNYSSISDQIFIDTGTTITARLDASSDTGVDTGDTITHDTTPTISGTAGVTLVDNQLVGDTVTVVIFGVETIEVQADANGNWSTTVSNELSDGTYIYSATSRDVAGNEKTVTNSITIDTQAPTPFTGVFDASSDSGIDNSDNLTNVTQPTFSGTGEAAAVVTLTIADNTYTTTVSDDGVWALQVVDVLIDGNYDYSLIATDVAGNSTSPLTGAITIDTQAPEVVLDGLSAATDTGFSNDDNITTNSRPVLTGVGEAGATIELQIVGSVFTTTVNAQGTWSIDLNDELDANIDLTHGSHSYTVTSTDAAGNTSQPQQSTITVDLNTPLVTRFTLDDTLLASGEQTTVTLEFDEPVYEFNSADDIQVENGTLSEMTSSDGGLTWTGTFTPSDNINDNSNSLTLAPNYKDLAGNSGVAATSDNYVVDTTAPQVNTVALASSVGGLNGILNTGDAVFVNVTFDENVVVDTSNGSPTITLLVGDESRQAFYVSGGDITQGGSSDLLFSYNIAPGDNDTDGIAIAADSISFNNGSIADFAGNMADLSHDAVAANSDYLVDTTAQVLNDVVFGDFAGEQNGYLNAGDTITVIAQFDGSVNVNTDDGSPTILIDIGGQTRTADYVSGSGSRDLLFTYTIGTDDIGDIAIGSNQLNLNGSIINDAAGNVITELGHTPVAHTTKVDTVAPTLTGVTLTEVTGAENGFLTVGDTVSIAVDFDEVVSLQTLSDSKPSLTLTIGGEQKQAEYSGGNNSNQLIFTYTIAAGDTDTSGITLVEDSLTLNGNSITDLAGNAIGSLSHSAVDLGYKVDTSAPVVTEFTLDNTNLAIGQTATVTLQFSEAIIGFSSAEDITVDNGTLSEMTTSDNGITWTGTFTPHADIEDADNVLTLADNYTDIAGNTGVVANTANYVIDTLAPSIAAVDIAHGHYKIGDIIELIITAANGESGLTLSSAQFNGQVLTSVTDNNDGTYSAFYTVRVGDPDIADGDVIVTSLSFTDAAGNIGETTTSVTLSGVFIDTIAPNVTSFTLDDSELIVGETAEVTLVFSEAVTNFASTDDITAENGSLSEMITSDGGITWTGIFTPTTDIEDANNVLTLSDTYTDVAGNKGLSVDTANYTIDTLAPTITSVAVADGNYKIGDNVEITITAANGESGLTLSSAQFNGQTLTNVTDNGDGTYSAVYTVVEGDPDVADGSNVISNLAFTDSSGNTGEAIINVNLSGESIDASLLTVDNFSISDTTLIVGETATVTLQFSEAVNSFNSADDILVENGTLSEMVSNDGGFTWTGTFTPTADIEDASNLITLVDTYTDIAGNLGVSAQTQNYVIDTLAPTISTVDVPDGVYKIGDTVTVTITAANNESGLTLSSAQFNGQTLTNVTDNNDGTYSAIYTVIEGDPDIADGASVATLLAFTDSSGNTGEATTNVILSGEHIDATIATVDSFTLSDTALLVGETAVVTLQFSEAVSGFNSVDDITVENGTLSEMVTTNGGITWTGTFTPTVDIEDASNILTLADTYTDVAGNAGVGATTANYTIDTSALTVVSFALDDSDLVFGESATVTLQFSEAVADFSSTDDISVENGSLDEMVSIDGGITWTGTFTPTADIEDASNILTLADTYTDIAGNLGVIATTANYAIDTAVPTVSSFTLDDTMLTIEETTTVTLTFSEPVVGFSSTDDITVENGILDEMVSIDGGITWTGTFTPSVDIEDTSNTLTLADTYTDVAGNTGVTALTANYSIDNVAPTVVSFALDDSDLTVGESAIVTLQFSEAVTSFNSAEDIAVDSGTLSEMATSDNGITWTGTFTPTADIEDASNALVLSNTYTDIAGNTGVTAITANYAIDTSAPTVVSFALSDSDLTVGESATVTLQFSEVVADFNSADDITVNNGTLSEMATSDNGITWTGTFTPTEDIEDASNTLTLADTYTDVAGNTGMAVTTANYAIDTAVPTVSSFTLDDTTLIEGETATVTLTFSEPVASFSSADDITVENGILDEMVSLDGGITWTGTFTPTADVEDASNILTLADTYTDIAGNAGVEATTANYTIDTSVPTVVSFALDDSNLAIGESATVTLQFSEAVTGFNSTDDITVENGILDEMVSLDGGMTWTGTFTPTADIEDGSNALTLSNTYTDIAGNTGVAAISANYAIDTLVPTVSSFTLDDTVLVAGETATVTLTFSEPVESFSSADDITVENGILDEMVSLDGGMTWTGTFTPSVNIEDTSNTLTLADTYTDVAGNTGVTALTANYSIDNVAPTVVTFALDDSDLTVGESAIVTLQFSEAVTSFNSTEDIAVDSGTLSEMATSDNGITWTGTFTPTADIEDASNALVLSNTYTDIVGNTGVTAITANYAIDTSAPTVVSFALSDSDLTVGESATVTLQFSEMVTNFNSTDDITVENGSLDEMVSIDGGITWTGTFTPTADIEDASNALTLADTYTDVAGNTGVAVTTANYAIDTAVPTVSSFTLDDTTLIEGETATVTLTFSEPVASFSSADDITVENGILDEMVSLDGGITWTGTFTPTADVEDASNILTLADTYTDIAGNAGVEATTANYTIDASAPTVVSFALSDSDLALGESATVTLQFSEVVANFSSADDITADNGTLSPMVTTDGGITWTGTFTPTEDIEDASNALTLADTYTDIAGNTGVTAITDNYTIDTFSATVRSVAIADGAYKIGDTVAVTITAANNESGLTLSSAQFNGQTLTNITDNNDGTYSAIYTVIEGDADIADGANVATYLAFTDAAGNTGEATTHVTLSSESIDANIVTVDTFTLSDTVLAMGENATVTLRFSETVTSFSSADDITVEQGTLSDMVTIDGGRTWKGTFTPNADIEDASNILTLASTYTDVAGNTGVTAITAEYVVDTIAPTVSSVVVADGLYKIGDTVAVTITAANGEPGLTLSSAQFNGQTLTNITDNNDGTYSAIYTVAAGDSDIFGGDSVLTEIAFTDTVGNTGEATTSVTSSNTRIDPTVVSVNNFTLDDSTLLIGETATVTLQFSEAVTSFDSADDITVNNGTLSEMVTSDNGITWTGTFTPTEDMEDASNALILADTYTDVAGNTGVTALTANFVIDTVAPTVSRFTLDDSALIKGETATVTLTFSEAVDGFSSTDDILVENGILDEMVSIDGGITWTGTFTPTVDIEDASNLLALTHSYTDVAGNTGVTATTANYVIDTSTPTVESFTLSDSHLMAGESTTVTLQFSEAITSFNSIDDIIVENGTLDRMGTIDGGITWVGTFTPTADIEDASNVLTLVEAYIDIAGNWGVAAMSANYAIDTAAPTVSRFTLDDSALISGETASVILAFSEAVVGFNSTDDITVENGTLSEMTTSDGGITWVGTFTPTEDIEDASNILTLADTYTDIVGNRGVTASTAEYVIDTSAPTVVNFALSDNDLIVGESATVTLQFSEAVAGFRSDADITVDNGTLSAMITSDGGMTWTGTFTPTADIEDASNALILADTYTDIAGNTGVTVATSNYVIDTLAPSVSSVTVADGAYKIGDTVAVTITAANGESGLILSSAQFNGQTLTNITDNNDGTYSAIYTVTEGNADIADGANVATHLAFTDSSGNTGEATTHVTLSSESIDANIVTVESFTLSDAVLASGETATVTLQFSEAVANFSSADDITVENGILDEMFTIDGGITWKGTFTPNVDVEDASNVLTLASTYNDIAGNTGVVASTANYVVDTSAPTVSSVTIAEGVYKIGDSVDVTITAANGESGLTLSSATFNGQTLINITDNSDGTYSAIYTVAAGDSDIVDGGSVLTEIAFTDTVGNTGEATTSVTLSNTSIDANAPAIASVTVADGVYKIGDTVAVTITADNGESGLTLSSAQFNGQTLTSITDNNDGTYSATYTVIEGDRDIADGSNVITNLVLSDAAGNASAPLTSVALSGELIDANLLTIMEFSISDNSLIVGETATVTLRFSEVVFGFDSTVDVTTQNGTLTEMTTTDGITWSGVFTPTADIEDTTNIISLSANYTDTAGNIGVAATSPNYKIDTIIPLITGDLDSSSDSGSYSDDGITNNPTPTFNGTSEAGATINLSIGGQIYSTIVSEDGNWSLRVDTPLADAQYSYILLATDASGNDSEALTGTITVDTVVPITANLTRVIYESDFENGAADWDNGQTGVTNLGDTYLGDFGDTGFNDQGSNIKADTQKIFSIPVGAETVAVNFDFLRANNWSEGDSFYVFVNGQAISLGAFTSSANQSSGTLGDISWNVGVGQLITGGIGGFTFHADSSHPVTLTINNPSNILTLGFGSTLDADASDESWGVNDIKLTTYDAVSSELGLTSQISSDTTPEFTGTGEAGANVELSIDGHTYSTAVTADGTWSILVSNLLADGGHDYSITTTDLAGNTSVVNSYINIDTQISNFTARLDAASDSGNLDNDKLTNIDTPSFSGTGEANATVILSINNNSYSGIVGNDGSWFITVDHALPNGNHNYQVAITDVAGNSATLDGDINVDTEVPSLTGGLDQGSDSGIYNFDNITNNTNPSFSGTGEEGATITLSIANHTYSGVVNENNVWVIHVSDTLEESVHNYSITSTDTAGNTSAPVTGAITVDTQVSTFTAGLDNALELEGALVASSIEPTFSGTGEPGSTVILTINNNDITTTVDSSGNWTMTSSTLGNQVYTATIAIIDLAGNTIDTQISFSIDAVALPSTVFLDSNSDTGESPIDGVTNDTNPRFYGRAESYAQVTFTIDSQSYTTTADSEGDWDVNVLNPLSDGLHSYNVIYTDQAGNIAEPAVGSLQIDTTPAILENIVFRDDAGRALTDGITGTTINYTATGFTESNGEVIIAITGFAPVTVNADVNGNFTYNLPDLGDGSYSLVFSTPNDLAGNSTSISQTLIVDQNVSLTGGLDELTDTGALQDDNLTNINTPRFSGTTDANATVSISIDGSVVGSVTASSQGDWLYEHLTPLADGVHSYELSATDTFGNSTDILGNNVSGLLTIDTSAPFLTGGLSTLSDTGVLGDGITTDTVLTYEGAGETGSTVILNVAGQTFTSDVVNGAWSITTSQLIPGEHEAIIVATDKAGNQSDTINQPVVIQSGTLPLTAFIRESSDTGVSHDNVTQDSAPWLEGKVTPGSVVTVTITNSQNQVVGTVTSANADALGNWSVQLLPDVGSALSDDNYTLDIVATSFDSTQTINDFALSIDNEISIFTHSLSAASDSNIAGDNITNANTPEITGQTDPGATVEVVINGDLFTTTANNAGNYSVPILGLGNGDYSYTVTVTDPAGNVAGYIANGDAASNTAATGHFSIDRQAPLLTTRLAESSDLGDSNFDNLTNDTTPTIIGTLTDDYSNAYLTINNVQYDITPDQDGDWSVTLPPLQDGFHSYQVYATDIAGNDITVQNTLEIRTEIDFNTKLQNDAGDFEDDFITNANNLELVGSTNPGNRIVASLFDANGTLVEQLTEVTTDGLGNYTVSFNGTQADGDYQVRFIVSDAAGNEHIHEQNVTIDTTLVALSYELSASSDTGRLGNDSITKDTNPTFVGFGDPDSKVNITLLNSHGEVVQTTLAAVDSAGEIIFGFASLTEDTYTIKAIMTDTAGNSLEATDVVFSVITTPPVFTWSIVEDINADNIINQNEGSQGFITYTGTGDPGDTITLLMASQEQETTVAEDGTWTITTPRLADFDYNFRLTAEDVAGNTSAVNSNVLFDTNLSLHFNLANATNGNNTSHAQVELEILTEPGASVQITVEHKNGLSYSYSEEMTVNSAVTLWQSPDTLPDGEYIFTMTATDGAGHTQSLEQTIKVDTVMLDLDPISFDGGTFDPTTGIHYIHDSSPLLLGTNTNNDIAKAELYIDGYDVKTTWSVSNNLSLLFNETLANGTYNYTVIFYDKAFNTVQQTGTLEIKAGFDTPPTVNLGGFNSVDNVQYGKLENLLFNGIGDANATVTVKINNQEYTTSVAENGQWALDLTNEAINDGIYAISTTVQDIYGNSSEIFDVLVLDSLIFGDGGLSDVADTGASQDDGITSDNMPTFTGTGDFGATVTLTIAGESPQTTIVDNNGQWSIQVASPLTDGQYTYHIDIVDITGNTKKIVDAGALTIDTSAPTSDASLVSSSDTGASSTDSITQDNMPIFAGTSNEEGATVTLSIDGLPPYTTTVVGGQWNLQVFPPLADGQYTYTVNITDLAGNSSDIVTAATLTIDTAAPVATGELVSSSDTGASSTDATTQDSTPTFAGTSDEEGATVTLTIFGLAPYTTTVVGGQWDLQVSPALADGQYFYTITITDLAGNSTDIVSAATFTVDTAAPVATGELVSSSDTGASSTDAITQDSTPTFAGTSDEEGATVTLSIDGLPPYTTTVVGGQWDLQVSPALADGQYNYAMTITDLAGNSTDIVSAATLTIDTAAPIATGELASNSDTGASSTDTITQDATPTFAGTSDEEGATITLSIGGQPPYITTVSDGEWSINVTSPLVDGSYSYTILSEDLAGNTSNLVSDGNLTIDTQAPVLTGNADFQTSDVTPLFSGNAGSVEAGAEVTVEIDGESYTGEVDENGDWSIEATQELSAGEHAYDVTIVDVAGNSLTESHSLDII